MKNNFLILIIGLSLIGQHVLASELDAGDELSELSAPANAIDKVKTTPSKKSGKVLKEKLSFDDELVGGSLNTPEALYISSRKKFNSMKMLYLKKDFNEQLPKNRGVMDP